LTRPPLGGYGGDPVNTPDGRLLIDEPLPHVRRLTLNRPEKRNALDNALRGAIFDALRAADADAGVCVSIIRGAGPCFSAGYDLSADLTADRPYPTAGGDGQWPRHVVEGWFAIWDLAKPVIAQVHGLQQINKRSVHRAMEIMGMRAAIRAGTELQALAFHQPASLAYRAEVKKNLNRALKERDAPFGDFRGRPGDAGA